MIPADAYDNAGWTYETRDSEEIAIVLTARWSADSYSLSYEDNDGKSHTVLVILNGKDGKFYKTEVQAFIEKFMKYDESFGSLPDAEKPDIVIVLNTSKKGNRYVNFDLMDA